jgi:hypothetical protein
LGEENGVVHDTQSNGASEDCGDCGDFAVFVGFWFIY